MRQLLNQHNSVCEIESDSHKRNTSAAYEIGYNSIIDPGQDYLCDFTSWHPDWINAFEDGKKDAGGDLYLDLQEL